MEDSLWRWMATAARQVARSIRRISLRKGRRGTQQYISRDPSSSSFPPTIDAEQNLHNPKIPALLTIVAWTVGLPSRRHAREITLPISEFRALQMSHSI